MSARPCSVCAKGVALVRFVDAAPELTAAALSRQAEAVGMDLSPARILTHRAHRQEEEPSRIAKTKKDFAALVEQRAIEQFERGELDLSDKETVPGIGMGLRAAKQIEDRSNKGKSGGADLAFALIAFLRGEAPIPQLEDGMTIDGEATELDPE